MELEKTLLEFIAGVASSRDEMAKSEGAYTSSDDKYNLSVYYKLEKADPNTLIRSVVKTGEVQARVDLFKFSEMSVFFWLVWAFVRSKCSSPFEADEIALPIALAAYPRAKRKDFAAFYQEYNGMLSVVATENNVKRSEKIFELVTDKLVNTFQE